VPAQDPRLPAQRGDALWIEYAEGRRDESDRRRHQDRERLTRC
jgi:hypothetical protein